MKMVTTRQAVEIFHLLFLDMLGRKIDKRRYALKGGANLRFFLKSIRYSEDIDLDAHGIPKAKLEDAVSGILESRPFRGILEVRDLSISRWSAPKQTETTQRWKIGLDLRGAAVPPHTKIEFSRRRVLEDVLFETADPALMAAYGISPIMANHYGGAEAFRQKVEALITRRATQARDVFDLDLLVRSGIRPSLHGTRLEERLNDAVSNAMSVTFDMFKSHVLSFLHDDYRAQYDSAAVWDSMVLRVVEALNSRVNHEA